MKKQSYGVIFATIAATVLIVIGAAASSQQMPGGMPPGSKPSQGNMPQHHQGMMDMSAMKQGPHHVLAMAYKDNLVNFANALRQEAAAAKTVNPEFARAAVAEMKRSFDQMQQHHQDHMKSMDDKMKTQMAGLTKQMDEHHSGIQEHLAALDKEVQSSAPATKNIDMHVAEILKHCDGMSKTLSVPSGNALAGGGDVQAGKAVYDTKCKTCHGVDGKGNPAVAKALKITLPDMTAQATQSRSDDVIKKQITEGSGKMKPVKGLTDQQISNVIAFVRSLAKS